MNDKEQPYELDMIWCINKCQEHNISTTENMLEAFADKVADIMALGEREHDAREMAFSLLEDGLLWETT